jgi:hypothetical protein
MPFQFAPKGKISLVQDKQINTCRFLSCPGLLYANDLFTDAVDLSESREVTRTHELKSARWARLAAVMNNCARGCLVSTNEIHP